MCKHIQPISHYPPHERIKTFQKKKRNWNNSHSNLTEGSAAFRHLEAVPKNDVTAKSFILGPDIYCTAGGI